MSYKALYRQWRPGSFEEIVGQQHITVTLKNALDAGRISHAYLFCGTRGTGKTTTAKVLARALNCRETTGALACNKCGNCRAILEGSSMDVVEIDAASNRGIDEIRDLRENINLSPSGGAYRVYIIDEVHMLTNEAFNALLKTLEEPPSHAVFILATTEPHRVPLTIISRCQRFDFRPVGEEKIMDRLRQIAENTGLEVEKDALKMIARTAEGSLRDAISLLDQASSLGKGIIKPGDIHSITGTVNEDILEKMTRYVLEGDPKDGIELIDSLFTEGKDLKTFARQLENYFRNLLVGEIRNPGRVNVDRRLLLHITRLLVRYEQEMRWSSQPRLLLELFLFEAIDGNGEESREDITLRLHRLEKKVEALQEMGISMESPVHYNEGEAAASYDFKEEEIDTEDVIKEEPGEFNGDFDLENNDHRQEEVVEERKEAEDGKDGKSEDSGEENHENHENHNEDFPGENNSVQDKKEEPAVSPGSTERDNNNNSITLDRIENLWPKILEEVRKANMVTYTYMSSCRPAGVSGNVLTLEYAKDDISKEMMEKEKNSRVLAGVLKFFFKGEWSIKCIYSSGLLDSPSKESPQDKKGSGKDGYEEALQLFGAEEVNKIMPE